MLLFSVPVLFSGVNLAETGQDERLPWPKPQLYSPKRTSSPFLCKASLPLACQSGPDERPCWHSHPPLPPLPHPHTPTWKGSRFQASNLGPRSTAGWPHESNQSPWIPAWGGQSALLCPGLPRRHPWKRARSGCPAKGERQLSAAPPPPVPPSISFPGVRRLFPCLQAASQN